MIQADLFDSTHGKSPRLKALLCNQCGKPCVASPPRDYGTCFNSEWTCLEHGPQWTTSTRKE
jgi:hypothetical protein